MIPSHAAKVQGLRDVLASLRDELASADAYGQRVAHGMKKGDYVMGNPAKLAKAKARYLAAEKAIADFMAEHPDIT